MKYAILFFIGFVIPYGSTADELKDQPVPIDGKVRIEKLDNGLTFYIRSNPKPKNRAELRLAVNAGSILEEEDQQGLAHFLEHMAFNGTENFEKQELVEYLQSIGMRFGADINAYTSFDETVYQLQVPTDDPEILEKAFVILSDWAHRIAFDEEEIDKERGVVVEEWRSRLGANSRITDKQLPKMLHGSRYVDRLPIGKKEIIETAPKEAFTRFYRDWYRPDLMAVVAVGDFDEKQIEKLIKKHMGAIPAAENPKPRPSFPVPDHEETLFSIEKDPELTNTLVQIGFKHPARKVTNKAHWRMSLVRGLYQGLINQRLYERTKEENPPFLFGSSSMGGYVRAKDMFFQSAMVKEGELEEGLTALLVEGKRVKRFGFTQAELDRQKKDIMRNLERAHAERDKTDSARYVGSYVNHFLDGNPIPGIENVLAFYRENLPTISLNEVNRAADNWITRENRVIMVSAPEKEGLVLPSEAEMLAIIAKADKIEVTPYVDQVSDSPLVSQPPKPGTVTDRKTFEEIGTEVWQLSNGVRVALKPTDFKNDEVRLAAFSPGGTSLVPDEDYIAAFTATSLINESGLGGFNSVELEKKLAGKVANAAPFIGETREGINAFASPKDLETMFQLIYLYFTKVEISDQAYNNIQTRWRAFLQNRDKQPGVVFSDKVQAKLFQNHPRRQPFDLSILQKMDKQKSLAFFRDRFADASDFTFVLIGNFDTAAIEPMITKWLGGLPALKRGESWRDIGVRTVTGQHEVLVAKGLEPKSNVRVMFTGDAEWNSETRYIMRSLSQALSIRMREVLREDLGGVYGVQIGGSLEKIPTQTFNAGFSFSCNPQRVDELIGAVLAELEKIKQDGFDEETIQQVKETQIRTVEQGLERNTFWMANITFCMEYDVPFSRILKYKERAAGLTSEMLRDAARNYFTGANKLTAVLNPEATAAN